MTIAVCAECHELPDDCTCPASIRSAPTHADVDLDDACHLIAVGFTQRPDGRWTHPRFSEHGRRRVLDTARALTLVEAARDADDHARTAAQRGKRRLGPDGQAT